MIGAFVRSVFAIALSLVVALAGIVIVEVVTLALHPFAAGADTTDHAVVEEHVAEFPAWVFAIGVVGWAGAVFASCWVATRLGTARHPAHGIVVGALLFAAALFNMSMLPYPFWVVGANLVFLPLAMFNGIRMGRDAKLQPADSESD